MKRSLFRFLSILIPIFLVLFSCAALLFVVRGRVQDNTLRFQSGYDTSVGSPFESSNSTSRYVLTESIVTRHTFTFTDAQARASSPDLVKYGGKYFSIFTPGVSMAAVPFYILGTVYGAPQLATFFLNTMIAAVNVFLVAKLAQKLGSSRFASYTCGLVFLFATNALVYSQTFTQHHLTVFVVILSIIMALRPRSWQNNIIMGFLYTAGLLFDIPNLFLLLPPLLYVVGSHINWHEVKNSVRINLHFVGIAIVIGMLPLLALYGRYNLALTNSYTKIGQFIGGYNYPDPNAPVQVTSQVEFQKQEERREERGRKLPLQTRLQLNGFQILLLSKQRSWLFYSPVVLLGCIGIFFALSRKETQNVAVIVAAVVITTIVVYASFGDPWGGWAFGPRYLIPAAALLCSGIGVLITKFSKGFLRVLLVSTVLLFLVAVSVRTSVLGAITTAAVPPKGEAEALKNDTPWTIEYNERILRRNQLASLAYNFLFSESLTGRQYLDRVSIGYFLIIAVTYLMALAELEVFGKRKSV